MNRSFEEPRVAAIGSYSYVITERGGRGRAGITSTGRHSRKHAERWIS
jgi:hypothetical protein